MKDDIITGISDFYETNILARIIQMWEHPVDLVLFLIDIAIVIFLAYKILKIKEVYFMERGKELSNEEVAKTLGVDETDVIIALDAMKDPVSMFDPIYNDGGDTIYLEDQIESKKEKASSWDAFISLKNAINNLKEKERRIITERFLIGKTQMEIAEEIGISQAQVSRLEKGGIEELKSKML